VSRIKEILLLTLFFLIGFSLQIEGKNKEAIMAEKIAMLKKDIKKWEEEIEQTQELLREHYKFILETQKKIDNAAREIRIIRGKK